MSDGLGRLIGQGREAEIYAWGEDRVLKLFFPSMPREVIELQVQAARVAHKNGIPTPAIGEIIDINKRYGVIFERIDGPSMLTQMMTHPWQVTRFARLLAKLQATIHDCKAPELRPLKETLKKVIESSDILTASVKEVVLQRLQRLPDDDALCHGDLHPENVIMSSHGPMIIDWSNGLRGDPMADVARTWLLICMGEPMPGTRRRWLIVISRAIYYNLYLKRYRQLHPFVDEELTTWKLLMVVVRLTAERIPEEQRRMMDYIKRGLGDRINS